MSNETPRPKRGRPLAADATKNIVQAATALFLDAGYAATTMQGIARRFGGSKQTIYARFPDKAALFQEVVRSFTDRRLREARKIAEMDGDAETVLRSVAFSLLQGAIDRETTQMMRLLIAEVDREPLVAEIMNTHSSVPSRLFVRQVIERFVDREELMGAPEELTSWFLDLTIATPLRNALFEPWLCDDVDRIVRQQSSAIRFFLKAARADHRTSHRDIR